MNEHTPFAKSNGQFFSNTKVNMMPLSNLYDFWWVHEIHASVHFWAKYLDFCINPLCTGVLNAVSVIFFKSSLNMLVNFIKWDLTDSDEILETLILTHCLNLVQISWRLASLLQNHSVIVYAYWQVCACKSNGRFFRHTNQHDALIQFVYILVDLYGICSWSIPVNLMEIEPMFFMQQMLELS